MFYVSSVLNEVSKIGVTDTRDSVEEFFTNKQIVRMVKQDKIPIFGLSIFDGIAELIPIKINTEPNKFHLLDLIKNWRKVHNDWTGAYVVSYLASLPVGVEICIDSEEDDGKYMFTRLKKLSYDEWLFECKQNTFDGRKGDHEFAAWAIDVACIATKCTGLTVRR